MRGALVCASIHTLIDLYGVVNKRFGCSTVLLYARSDSIDRVPYYCSYPSDVT
jgi:hypothetical protein